MTTYKIPSSPGEDGGGGEGIQLLSVGGEEVCRFMLRLR
jgi:hypothetical protein